MRRHGAYRFFSNILVEKIEQFLFINRMYFTAIFSPRLAPEY